MAKKKAKKKKPKAKSTKKVTKPPAAAKIEGTFARYARSREGEDLAFVKPSKGGQDWQMDPPAARKLGLKPGDPVVGIDAHPGKKGRRFLKNVRRRRVRKLL